MTLAEAKQRVSIYDLWAHYKLPGDCHKNPCHSPFYERHSKPSFSVFDDGRAFKDQRTGEGGSAVDFIMLATGKDEKAACKELIEIAGGTSARVFTPRAIMPATAAVKPIPTFPPMDEGTEEEWQQLAALRHIDIVAVRIAVGAGLLRFATIKGVRAWIVTDDERLNAQARRLDGKTWGHLDGAKAFTLPGSRAAWPLGIKSGGNYPAFMLCEGGPDLLAAIHFIARGDIPGAKPGARLADVFPLAMLGASQRIHPDALPFLKGKKVRIFAHADDAGSAGAERWRAQLRSVGATVSIFHLEGLRKADGSPVKDLNDCTQIHADDAAQLEGILP